jgi:hypothetical protein
VSSSGMWPYSDEECSDDEWYSDEGGSDEGGSDEGGSAGGGGGAEPQAEPWPQEVLQAAGDVLGLLLAWPASGEDMFGVGGGTWCGAVWWNGWHGVTSCICARASSGSAGILLHDEQLPPQHTRLAMMYVR